MKPHMKNSVVMITKGARYDGVARVEADASGVEGEVWGSLMVCSWKNEDGLFPAGWTVMDELKPAKLGSVYVDFTDTCKGIRS